LVGDLHSFVNKSMQAEYQQLYIVSLVHMVKAHKDLYCSFEVTPNERISSKARYTAANGIVIYDSTVRIESARCHIRSTRIQAFLIRTRFILRTFGTDHALWSAHRWSSYVIRLARTNCVIIDFTTLTVRTARGRLTWVLWRFFFNYVKCRVNLTVAKMS
jgi:hypothetical protein